MTNDFKAESPYVTSDNVVQSLRSISIEAKIFHPQFQGIIGNENMPELCVFREGPKASLHQPLVFVRRSHS